MSAPADPRARSAREPGLAATVALYALARLGLLALIAALLLLAGTPFVIALLVALIVALPLSMFVFRGLRTRLDVALAAARARRGGRNVRRCGRGCAATSPSRRPGRGGRGGHGGWCGTSRRAGGRDEPPDAALRRPARAPARRPS